MPLITLDTLTHTIQEKLKCDTTQARAYANTLLDHFYYHDRIPDNRITNHDRKLFYEMERLGIIQSGREDMSLPDGRRWRIHYWILEQNKRAVKKLQTKKRLQKKTTIYKTIYNNIPAELWNRRRTGA